MLSIHRCTFTNTALQTQLRKWFFFAARSICANRKQEYLLLRRFTSQAQARVGNPVKSPLEDTLPPMGLSRKAHRPKLWCPSWCGKLSKLEGRF